MYLPAIEKTLIGLWLAQEGMDTFLAECDRAQDESIPRETDDEKKRELAKLRELVAWNDEDVDHWLYQLRQLLAMGESLVLPKRVRRARSVYKKIEARFAGPKDVG